MIVQCFNGLSNSRNTDYLVSHSLATAPARRDDGLIKLLNGKEKQRQMINVVPKVE